MNILITDSVTEGDESKEERVVENGELRGDRAGPDANSAGSIYVTTTADITPVNTKVMRKSFTMPLIKKKCMYPFGKGITS